MNIQDTNASKLAIAHASGKFRGKDGADPFAGLSQKIADMADAMKKRADDSDAKAAVVSEEISDLQQKMARGMIGGGTPSTPTWGTEFIEAKSGDIAALSGSNSGKVQLDVKATLTTGATSGGAIDVPMRDATAMLPRQRLLVRSLLNVVQTTSGTVEYADQTTRTNNAATVAEGTAKPESVYEWELKNIPTRVVAHWIKASRQILDDAPQIRDLIDSELRYGLGLVEEAQLLFGDGTGANLTGLVPAATDFADPLSLSSPDMIDNIGSAILQVALADHMPDGIVMHPADWMRMRLIKDADGRYLLGDPQKVVTPSLFGLPVIATKSMTVDKFLVGSFTEAGTLYDRWQPRVEVGYVNDDFTKNLATILAEERLALAVKKATALSFGDFGNVA